MKKIIKTTKGNFKKGFTLIELVVAMAIFFIIIAVAITSISRFYLVRTFYDQQMDLQQNFLYAMGKLSDDFRQATVVGGSAITQPGTNAMGETFEFYGSDGNSITYKLVNEGGGTYAIYRNSQPVTENMHQLVKLYFITQGGRVLAIIVGKATYMGTTNTVSFTSLIYSRNSPQGG